RFPRELRDSPQDLKALPLVTPTGAAISLDSVADVSIVDGPPMIKSENARLSLWVDVDIRGRDLGSFVAAAQDTVERQVEMPAGYSLSWSGQFEYFERATERLKWVVPA